MLDLRSRLLHPALGLLAVLGTLAAVVHTERSAEKSECNLDPTDPAWVNAWSAFLKQPECFEVTPSDVFPVPKSVMAVDYSEGDRANDDAIGREMMSTHLLINPVTIGFHWPAKSGEGKAAKFLKAAQSMQNNMLNASLTVLLGLCFDSKPSCVDGSATGSVDKQLRKMIRSSLLRYGNWSFCTTPAECTNQPNVPRRAELEQWIDIELKLWPQNQQVKGLRMLLAGEVSAATYIRSYPAVEAPPFEARAVGPTGNAGGLAILPDDTGRQEIMLFNSKPNCYVLTVDFEQKPCMEGMTDLEEAVFTGKPSDYNNDGEVEVFVTRGGFLRAVLGYPAAEGKHGNTFVSPSGVKSASDFAADHKEHVCASHFSEWADFDLDGYQDLFVACEADPCQLWRNRGDGTFEDVAAQMGLDQCGWAKGVAWIYYNGDNYPDIAIVTFGGYNKLHENIGGRAFRDVSEKAGISLYPRWGFAMAAFDFNNDGFEDILFGSYVQPMSLGEIYAFTHDEPWDERVQSDELSSRLYINQGDGTFKDATRAVGLDGPLLTMGMNIGDINNDGFIDVYFGLGDNAYSSPSPNLMFRNIEGKHFAAAKNDGLSVLAEGHGIGFLDVNNDGHQDIISSLGGAWPFQVARDIVFINPGSTNGWIKVSLRGRQAARIPLKAKVIVAVSEGGAERLIPISYGLTAAFGANPITVQHIGLGKASSVNSITVVWPYEGGKVARYGPFDINSEVLLDERLRFVTGHWPAVLLAG